MGSIIEVKELAKSYIVYHKEPGLVGSLRSLYCRRKDTVAAVKDITLSIGEGELVGFIGPNGAGKTTTLKMLSGLLHPSGGHATVLGYTPWQRQPAYLEQVSLVMGQKNQLWWDLPLIDSLLLQKDLYNVSESAWQESLAELIELLDLEKILTVQVRRLSLGQRMRAELAAALIYRPKVLFLDEPTIGLDIVVQRKIREFIKQYKQRHRATIILTSHYLDDVRELADRIIIIDQGEIRFDGTADQLIKQHVNHRRIVLNFTQPVERATLEKAGRLINFEPHRATLQVPRTKTSSIAAELLAALPVEDIAIAEPSLEDVVRELFSGKDYA
ncbi:MAG: ABC transporter [Candidatus Andersenbacteria bacterium CG10_big_fil_rev_8_21_14_0_10_54_11]|uniref:ABC transporter n=1 Tax=Candidatus Andersenbacteria bacterium CG10_big_fil_rev_8_21_14_0_10_54_11 TaxID=1974485 RepID=A0A2M6X0H5_9BACT|nr:MAG: ABC transporter [Candidatus Andersenbacteria bacterium CG10_big_fil_rev_8_21_14_0_10_54_11]